MEMESETSDSAVPYSLNSRGIVWANPKAITVTLQDRRITDDSRISVERPTTTSWNLHIREVEPSDGGIYSCHINTSPVKVKRINLIVQVPPKIIDHLSSVDTNVREGETVSLVCNVTGIPQPTVTWYRQKRHEGGVKELPPKIIDHLSSVDTNVREGETVSLVCNVTGIPQPTVTWYRQKRHEGGVKEQVGPPGEVLIIHNVTRYCDDIYTCEASNGVPPNSYRKIAVKVLFLPDVRLPIKRMGQIRGKETILDCMITAVPLGGMSWERNGITLKKSWKYRIEPYDESGNSYTLSIRIIDLNKDDFGEYTCVASNILGEDQETMILYDATAEKEQISSPRGGYVKHNHDKKKNSTIRKNGKSNYPPRTDIRSDIPTPPDDTRSPHRLGGTLFPPNIGSVIYIQPFSTPVFLVSKRLVALQVNVIDKSINDKATPQNCDLGLKENFSSRTTYARSNRGGWELKKKKNVHCNLYIVKSWGRRCNSDMRGNF
ncbi:opioid-binding cell adhesion molecule homolog [Octopus vulgaris]|uniref:Opioid-binding cell adhesion molecule homolog n=1 Tax=Octopus vulgaris TaxID=6645 RepID=A0AA36BC39_OCTVU|nr:opioid-binding cell adhesion molecule homolog [Octopus vulgaris]